jgi:hypothetical protein
VNTNSPRNSNLDNIDPPYSTAWEKLAVASESANVQSFALVARARGLSGAQFRKSGVGAVTMPYLYPCKELANTLADGAEYAHFKHDEALALDRVMDVLHLARSLRQDDFFVSQLVAIGIESLACHSAQIIARDLAVDPRVRDSEEIKGKMRRIIGELLDEGPAVDGWRRAMMDERLVMADEYRKRGGSTWLVRPLGDRHAMRTLAAFEVIVKSTNATNFPQVQVMYQALDRNEEERQPLVLYGPQRLAENVPRYSRWFADDWFRSSAGAERQFRALAERRVTAAALACQIYRAEQGRWPEKLAQLVPKYLAAGPVDPFQSDGREIGYMIVRTAGSADRPVVYFDPGGSQIPVPATQMLGWFPMRAGQPQSPVRQYRDLAPYSANSSGN